MQQRTKPLIGSVYIKKAFTPLWIIETDGSSLGNPGPAGSGIVIRNAKTGDIVRTFSFPLGRQTNNAAEYLAMLNAVKVAREQHLDQIEFRSDSRLLVSQILGEFKVHSQSLREIYKNLMDQLFHIHAWTIILIPREQNKEADRLARFAAKSLSQKDF